jgi:hypothetical protein
MDRAVQQPSVASLYSLLGQTTEAGEADGAPAAAAANRAPALGGMSSCWMHESRGAAAPSLGLQIGSKSLTFEMVVTHTTPPYPSRLSTPPAMFRPIPA